MAIRWTKDPDGQVALDGALRLTKDHYANDWAKWCLVAGESVAWFRTKAQAQEFAEAVVEIAGRSAPVSP